MIQYSRGVSDNSREAAAELLLLARNRLRLRLQRLRIEADIEDVGIAGRSGRHRIHQILSNQSERYAAVFGHRYRRPVGLGGDRLLLHAALHYRDTKWNLDRGGGTGRTGDDPALDANPRADLVTGFRTLARGAGDRRLKAQVIADGLLARRGHGIGRGSGADADRGTGQVV